MATPAIADGVLYIRGLKHVIAIAAPKRTAASPADAGAPRPGQPSPTVSGR